MPRLRFALVVSLLVACAPRITETPRPTPAPELVWQPWSAATFERAAAENKLLLVSVQAGWCHWCHVMNEETFTDPNVRRTLAEHFVAIRVDADARPDLAERYARWAWPATGILTPQAAHVTALRGYRSAARFDAWLRDLADRHTRGEDLADQAPSEPEERAVAAPDLEALLAQLVGQLDGFWDPEAAGWGTPQKYPLAAPLLYAFERSRTEPVWVDRAIRTAEGHARLLDPIWGGVYQYSLEGDWDHPHYEKIVSVQADALRAFAAAYRVTGDARWQAHGEAVRTYLSVFLRAPDGAFYTSQDADLRTDDESVPGVRYYALPGPERRALGIPRIDRHVYADRNGMLIHALVQAYGAGDDAALPLALGAARRVEATHRDPEGGFLHAEGDRRLRHLSDQVWMARAELDLYEATGDVSWWNAASRTVSFLQRSLAAPDGGFFAHTEDPAAVGVFTDRRTPVRDNAIAADTLLRMARMHPAVDPPPNADDPNDARVPQAASGDEPIASQYQDAALDTLRALGRDQTALNLAGRKVGELVLALARATEPYVLVSVVGPENDPRTDLVHRAALRTWAPGRMVERAGPRASRYPYPGEPAAYLCSADACSLPVLDGGDLPQAVERFLYPSRESSETPPASRP